MDFANKTIYYPGKNALRLEWPSELSLKYGVLITFNDGEEEADEVKYEVSVTRLRPGTEGQALFQIDRISGVFINGTLPDLIADRLAAAAGKVFYPLIIAVDQNRGSDASFKKDFTILEKPDTPWYKSNKEYL